ncbi:hypothetical protein A2U01_0038151, partial [Trifolium medium]|nr:hypothetical protein [Trifolium medium]
IQVIMNWMKLCETRILDTPALNRSVDAFEVGGQMQDFAEIWTVRTCSPSENLRSPSEPP